MIIHLTDWGHALGSRALGAAVRSTIEQGLPDAPVTLSFTGIIALSNAFADECFGKLITRIGRAQFLHAAHFAAVSPTHQAIILDALNQRLSQEATGEREDQA